MFRLLGLLLALCHPDCRIALPAGYQLALAAHADGGVACLRGPDGQVLLCSDEVLPRLRRLAQATGRQLPTHAPAVAVAAPPAMRECRRPRHRAA
jgi:hypothetical protein